MPDSYAVQAIQVVLNSRKAYCKFLSANDTGLTGGHQAGIYISKPSVPILFDEPEIWETPLADLNPLDFASCNTKAPCKTRGICLYFALQRVVLPALLRADAVEIGENRPREQLVQVLRRIALFLLPLLDRALRDSVLLRKVFLTELRNLPDVLHVEMRVFHRPDQVDRFLCVRLVRDPTSTDREI